MDGNCCTTITLTAVTPTGRAELSKGKVVGTCSFLFLMMMPGNEFGTHTAGMGNDLDGDDSWND